MNDSTPLPRLSDRTLPALLQAPAAVVILSRTGCGYCAAYEAEVAALAAGGEFGDVRVGVLLLDQPGGRQFTEARPWLARLEFLPYNLLYRFGEQVDGFATSRAAYLAARMQAAFAALAAPPGTVSVPTSPASSLPSARSESLEGEPPC